MIFKIILFVLTMVLLTIMMASDKNDNLETLDKRKNQSKELLRENILKKRLEELTEEKVKYSKRYKIETMCLQAGYKLSYTEYLIISIFSGIVSAIFTLIVMGNPYLAVIFLFLGQFIPKQVIEFVKNKRITAMEKQIGVFMNMVLKRYETTNDFGKALELSLIEFRGEEPIYSELKQAVFEINLGLPVSEAMDNLARRTGNKYMDRLADYYKISSTIGTEETRKKLLSQAYVQFDENRQAKNSMKERLSTPVREAYIMLASIPLFAVYQIVSNDDYIRFMTKTSTGQIGTTFISVTVLLCIWFINAKIGKPIE
ncbi:MAG: hypothetical protein K0R54_63 [Clostridiaceae bacterium]|jgi:tight adherence protein B|nr:hypothetical protein [Clostridiaceae bacterium]